jgi:GntR family transcriptional regulator, transcriptional repressor for pyruvate dehydrogenase complex
MVSPGRQALRETANGAGHLVRVPKAAELVAADLRRQIIRGELAEGDALPPESDLMARFGVSRPTLREAFRVLESESLINVRRGARGGARVQPPGREVAARYAGFTLEYRGVTLRDVYDARAALEVPSVGRLALNRTDADLDILGAALGCQDAVAQDARESIRLHGDFHTLLVRLAGNQTLTLLNEVLHDIVEVANTSLQPAGDSAVQSARESTSKTHRRVVEHIRARDQRRAEDLWRRHLQEAGGYLLGEDVVSTVTDLLR